ncbi:MAG: hypothetical protein WD016_12440 [Balneolaceae bacterium]
MSRLKSGLLYTTLVFIAVSCSPTDKISTAGSSESVFPAWYNSSGFTSDSLYFSTYATAISSDSLRAVSRAENQARVNLESRIAEKLEIVRNQLEEKGSEYARQADFILTLRNAYAPVETKARVTEGVATKNENHYRGFAKVSVEKNDLRNIIEAGFAGKATFWAELTGSTAFTKELK